MAAPYKCSGLHPASAASRTTEQDNAPRLAGTEGVEDQSKAGNDDATAALADGKALATMRARAVQAGCVLHELSGGGYLLCRWGWTKELPCLRAVGDLLRRMGGQHG
jgi:hypothetical protein